MTFFNLISIILGACVGSFLNVVIFRLPRGESIVTPRSYCLNCNSLISWYDNIPMISWLLLGKKCRRCHKQINIQYPLIEFFTSLLFLFVINSQPSNFEYFSTIQIVLSGWILITILIPLTIIDLKHLWLPQSICFIGIISGIFLAFINLLLNNFLNYTLIFSHLTACILGFLIIILIDKLGKMIFKKPAIGLGDAKLCALIGSWLGIKGLFITLYIAFIASGIFAFLMILTKRLKFGQPFPFGPFLTSSCFAVWFFGNDFYIDFFINKLLL